MKIIGHRGARGLAPENTLTAIKKGLEAGADEIEVDVQVTRDGVPMLWHDEALADTRIASYTRDELCVRMPGLCTLEKAIRTVDGRAPMIVEVKPGVPVEPVIAVLRNCLHNGWKPDNFRLASFGKRTLEELHAALPDIQPVVNQSWFGTLAAWRARRVGAKRLCMNHHFIWWGFVSSAKKNGYELYAYPLNNPAKARRWAKHGLAGTVTDHPERFAKNKSGIK